MGVLGASFLCTFFQGLGVADMEAEQWEALLQEVTKDMQGVPQEGTGVNFPLAPPAKGKAGKVRDSTVLHTELCKTNVRVFSPPGSVFMFVRLFFASFFFCFFWGGGGGARVRGAELFFWVPLCVRVCACVCVFFF